MPPTVLRFLATLCLLSSPLRASAPDWSLKPAFSLAQYALHESHPFFSDESRSWMETSARFGGRLQYRQLAIEALGIGLGTMGRDPYGSGSATAGSPPGTLRPGSDPVFDIDTLFLQWHATNAAPFKLTLGRQPITIGSQFLVGDGVYDGFHPEFQQAVYHNPRRWFDAARLEFDAAQTHFDAFVYRTHPTWDGGGNRDGFFGGLDVSHTFESIQGTYAAGAFWRESHSNLDNDMAVFNARFEQHWPKAEDLYVSGEAVWETGRGLNAYYVTTPGQDLNEYAWHAELGYQASQAQGKPFAEAGYVYYSGDFTPVATGFSDWGKWFLGHQIDWIVFSTNTRIVRAQAGFWPHEKVKVRAQYHNTRLVNGASGTLSDEVCVIGEWYPNARTWVNLIIGYAMPGEGLARSGLGNPFAYLNTGASAVGNQSSVDVVLAFGVSF